MTTATSPVTDDRPANAILVGFAIGIMNVFAAYFRQLAEEPGMGWATFFVPVILFLGAGFAVMLAVSHLQYQRRQWARGQEESVDWMAMAIAMAGLLVPAVTVPFAASAGLIVLSLPWAIVTSVALTVLATAVLVLNISAALTNKEFKVALAAKPVAVVEQEVHADQPARDKFVSRGVIGLGSVAVLYLVLALVGSRGKR